MSGSSKDRSLYSIGLDYGTLSVRALLVNIETGEEAGVSVYEYPHGVMETCLPSGKKLPANWALQHPKDYTEGMITVIRDIMSNSDVRPEDVVGIGIDFTGSTVIPVRCDGEPLCYMEQFQENPHAYVKLWKHHGCEAEGVEMENAAIANQEKWLPLYGGKVSCEWMLPKVWETLRCAKEVYDAADRFIDAMDWIVWQLGGKEVRSACAVGYKTFYHHEMGYPSKEYLKGLDARLENFVEEKIGAPITGIGETAGYLTEEMAAVLGLMPGTPIGTGMVDAHVSMLGSGITKPGEMMIVMGTSSCHLLLGKEEVAIPGISGVVKDGILPGYFGYEAGQSCVGDHFAWFVKNCVPESYEIEAREKKISIHQLLVDKLEGYKAGQSGLLALDWYNGVRTPLADFNLNGMILGMNLLTKPEEIYLALIEATAYGTRLIMEQYEQAGVDIQYVVLGGGIPMKNPMLVQVYADVLNRDIGIAGTTQTAATGAAILGIAAAPKEITGYRNLDEIVEKIGKRSDLVYHPVEEQVAVYNQLYAEYKELGEYFGKGGNHVMKRLNKIREDRQNS